MGLLDRLGNEAGAARARRQRDEVEQAASTAAAETRLRPALDRARVYFETLRAHLNDIDRVVVASYDVPGAARLESLEQRGYTLSEDVADPGRGFRLAFRCTGRVPVEVRLGNDSLARRHQRDLEDAGLTCRRRTQGPKLELLTVEPEVPVSVAFSMDLEGGAVLMSTRNLFALGRQTHRFAPERVDEPLLESVAHCVLREPSCFADLVGDTVGAAERAEIRKQLERDRRRRDAELRGGVRRSLFPVMEWMRRTFLGR